LATKKLLVSLILLFCFGALSVSADELYFRFQIKERKELVQITRLVSIENVRDNTVFAIGTSSQLDQLSALGYQVELLPHPSSLAQPEMAPDKTAMADWNVYPTYTAYVQMMYDFETNYPNICRTYSIGNSVQGRELLYVKISDNVDVEEAEPEVMYTSTMHGDETTGYVLMLRLIDSILTTYGTDAEVTDMVDNMEIWINPLANPDGTYRTGNNSVSGAIRYNFNSVDLNRNFPDPDEGAHPDGNAWQPETIAMMNIAVQQSWIISANFHGGAEVVNYPWDTWSRRHPDDDWYQDVCRHYAESCQTHSPAGYMNDLNDGITNGWDWYPIYGGRQDYMNFWRGCREVTIELSNTKLLSASLLPAHWVYNRISFFDWLRQANYGVRGIVTDSVTGLPLFATISVVSHDVDSSEVYTDPDVGDYYRMIAAGIYSLRFSSIGYQTKTISNVTVADFSSTMLDVQLSALPSGPSLEYQSNNAGRVDPGETALFRVTLLNNGAGNANNPSGTLYCADSLITVTNDYSTFATIFGAGGTGQSLAQFGFEAAAACPKYHMAQFELHITADGGYDDTIEFEIQIGDDIEDFETAGFAEYDWVMAGNIPWQIYTTTFYEGTYCSGSGNIGDNQSSQMSVTFDDMLAGNISFAYRVSSESNYDTLCFYVDEVRKAKWSGNLNWAVVSYPVDSGGHTFKWTYSKDVSISSGLDGGFIDLIEFPQVVVSGPTWICGDIDGNGQFQGILELNYLINYIFRNGTPPPLSEPADVNGSGGDPNVLDLNYMVNFIFRNGPAPACL
jgi:hypothetical protein